VVLVFVQRRRQREARRFVPVIMAVGVPVHVLESVGVAMKVSMTAHAVLVTGAATGMFASYFKQSADRDPGAESNQCETGDEIDASAEPRRKDDAGCPERKSDEQC
jgi:hypothetical protein